MSNPEQASLSARVYDVDSRIETTRAATIISALSCIAFGSKHGLEPYLCEFPKYITPEELLAA